MGEPITWPRPAPINIRRGRRRAAGSGVLRARSWSASRAAKPATVGPQTREAHGDLPLDLRRSKACRESLDAFGVARVSPSSRHAFHYETTAAGAEL